MERSISIGSPPSGESCQDAGSVDYSTQPTYQIYPLIEGIKDAIRPWLKHGEKLIWRDAFRWKDDSGVMPNHCESHSLAQLCEEHGYELVHDFHHLAVVRVPTCYERALSAALRAALGERCNVCDLAERIEEGRRPAVEFWAEAVERTVADAGLGEVFFFGDSACNDNGWCEGDSVVLIDTEAGPAVLQISHTRPEYCDDECDATIGGTARFFTDEASARAFAQDVAGQVRLRYCTLSIERALRYGVHADAPQVAQSMADAVRNISALSDSKRLDWLREFCSALVRLS